MRKYEEKENECEGLEVEVVSLRKQQEMGKTIVALDNLLEIQRSTMHRYGIGFQQGESHSYASKKKKEEPKNLVVNNTKKKSTNQGNKKQNQQKINQHIQQ